MLSFNTKNAIKKGLDLYIHKERKYLFEGFLLPSWLTLGPLKGIYDMYSLQPEVCADSHSDLFTASKYIAFFTASSLFIYHKTNVGKMIQSVILPPAPKNILENISDTEVENLSTLIYNFAEKYNFGPIDNYDSLLQNDDFGISFIKYLKQRCKLEELKTLVKLGADKSDCHLDFFEELGANEVCCNKGLNSLQWLAAKAVTKQGINLTKENSNESVEAIVKTTKKYI